MTFSTPGRRSNQLSYWRSLCVCVCVCVYMCVCVCVCVRPAVLETAFVQDLCGGPIHSVYKLWPACVCVCVCMRVCVCVSVCVCFCIPAVPMFPVISQPFPSFRNLLIHVPVTINKINFHELKGTIDFLPTSIIFHFPVYFITKYR